jgi:large subunit ribosomal protein L18
MNLQARLRRKRRIRRRLSGTPDRPRLSVYRSAKHIYAQVIDDVTGSTLVATSSLHAGVVGDDAENKTAAARAVGAKLAELCKESGVARVVFDRNGFIYHGRVKALAEGAREAGLDF